MFVNSLLEQIARWCRQLVKSIDGQSPFSLFIIQTRLARSRQSAKQLVDRQSVEVERGDICGETPGLPSVQQRSITATLTLSGVTLGFVLNSPSVINMERQSPAEV
jgi:hypothetical protein